MHTGLDYLMELPIDELNDLAEEVTAYAKRQGIRARH
nr:MAG TPA: hypothetical protein [Caudoviricetes sp.]